MVCCRIGEPRIQLGIGASANTPPEIIEKLNKVISAAPVGTSQFTIVASPFG